MRLDPTPSLLPPFPLGALPSRHAPTYAPGMKEHGHGDEPAPGEPDAMDEGPGTLDDAVEIPIEDALDLHLFSPRDVKPVVEEYLYQCRARGLAEVRIIHGRGTGTQREIVRATLSRSAHVVSFADAPAERGGWGATVVRLRAGSP